MTKAEAIAILSNYQQWRKGAKIELIDVKLITQAIDVILIEYNAEIIQAYTTINSEREQMPKAKSRGVNNKR